MTFSIGTAIISATVCPAKLKWFATGVSFSVLMSLLCCRILSLNYWSVWPNQYTELSYPTGSALSKMSSNKWIKAQILTRLAKSDGHLNKLTYCLTSCLCQMKLTTSFCQKCQKIWLFQSFFRMDQTVDMCLWESGREGQERKKVCCGRVGIFVFITWPWFLLFWRLLQTSGGPLIDVC